MMPQSNEWWTDQAQYSALVTAARALPGAKDIFGHEPGGQCRDEDTGIQWVPSHRSDWESGGAGCQVPDLTDAATGGVLLCALGPGWSVMHGGSKSAWEVWGWDHGDLDREFRGPTLAAACCRAAIAIGRWPS